MRGSQGTELAASTLLVLDWSYFSGEEGLGYHQDTHLGARGALSTLRVVSRSEKAVDKARKSMGKPACSPTVDLLPWAQPLRNAPKALRGTTHTPFTVISFYSF